MCHTDHRCDINGNNFYAKIIKNIASYLYKIVASYITVTLGSLLFV